MFDKILNEEPAFPTGTNRNLIDLMKKLLEKNREKRMEFAKNIKTHSFFSKIDFEKVYTKEYPTEYVPEHTRGKKMLKIIKDDVSAFIEF